jgi:hypothetical protein
MSTTELAVRENTPAELMQYGDKQVLELLANRIGMFYAIGETDARGNLMAPAAKEHELKLARPALLKAAQMTYQYGLVPGVDIFIIKRGGKYSADASLEMWKKMAERHGFLGKFRWTVDVEELTAAEVKEQTDPSIKYDGEDKGARARLFRFDVADEMRKYGLKYRPAWHYGFWRKNATEKDEWQDDKKTGRKISQPDTVPNGRTRQDVAIRRATKAAIMAEFSMIAVDDFEKRYQSEERAGAYRVNAALRQLDVAIQEQGRPDGEEEGGTFVEVSGSYMDDNGDVWATEKTPQQAPVIVVPPGTEDKPKAKAKGKKAKAPAVEAPVEAAPEPEAPAEGPVPDGTPAPWQGWQYPPQAHAWAIQSGAVADQSAAIVAWRAAVAAVYPGKKNGITPAEGPAVYERYYNDLTVKA